MIKAIPAGLVIAEDFWRLVCGTNLSDCYAVTILRRIYVSVV